MKYVKDAEWKMSVARAYVMQFAPYYTPTLLGFIPTPIEHLEEQVGGPLAVSERLVLFYDPAWVMDDKTSNVVLATGLGHEVMHHQLEHIRRGEWYADKERWNRAGDLFINGSMATQKKSSGKNAGSALWEFPDWALMPGKYGFEAGLSADAYYKLLTEYEKKQELPKGAKVMCGSCGSVAGNKQPGLGALEDKYNEKKGRSKGDCQSIADQTAKEIEIALGANRGNIPGSWAELAKRSEKIFRVPWKQKFANSLRQAIGTSTAGGMDYSRRRPSKRSYLRGITLPSLVGHMTADVLFILDSSGSMMKPQLADSLRIFADVLQQTGIQEARFMEADAGVQREPIVLRTRDFESLVISGRGGTDFRPALKYAGELKQRPQIVVYATEGDGPWPEEPPPGIHVIRAIVPSPYQRIPNLEWGETIVLDDDFEAPEAEEDEDD